VPTRQVRARAASNQAACYMTACPVAHTCVSCVVLSLVVRRVCVCVVSHVCGECRYIAAKRKYEALMANKDLAKVRADAVPLGLGRTVVWSQTRAHTFRADCWSSRDGTPCTGSRTPSRASSRSPTRSRPSTPHTHTRTRSR